MIKAKLWEDKGVLHFEAKGHAETAPKGADLVCAGMSALAGTVAQNVQTAYEHGWLQKKPKLTLKEGESNIVFSPLPEHYPKLAYMLLCIQAGVMMLAFNNPDSVSVTPFGKS